VTGPDAPSRKKNMDFSREYINRSNMNGLFFHKDSLKGGVVEGINTWEWAWATPSGPIRD
jgi:hypothetical protein